jgi:hypothetical protein
VARATRDRLGTVASTIGQVRTGWRGKTMRGTSARRVIHGTNGGNEDERSPCTDSLAHCFRIVMPTYICDIKSIL